jgi:hypothetical protein
MRCVRYIRGWYSLSLLSAIINRKWKHLGARIKMENRK